MIGIKIGHKIKTMLLYRDHNGYVEFLMHRYILINAVLSDTLIIEVISIRSSCVDMERHYITLFVTVRILLSEHDKSHLNLENV